MKCNGFVVLLLCLSLRTLDAQETSFSYHGNTGPNNWPELFEDCGGKHQSPIPLSSEDSVPSYLDPVEFVNYDIRPIWKMLINNGHAAQMFLTFPESYNPILRGGGFEEPYKFKQLHFHWGRESNRGAEHTIDGKRYQMEMHLVHYNSKYKNVEEAMKKEDGIAVIAVLFKLSDFNNPFLNPLLQALPEIEKPNSKINFRYPINVLNLIPTDRTSFYRYKGSLTTPMCNEVVLWTVFNSVIPISEYQIAQFRKLINVDNLTMGDNFRPLQNINDRFVLYNRLRRPPDPRHQCMTFYCTLYSRIGTFFGSIKNYFSS